MILGRLRISLKLGCRILRGSLRSFILIVRSMRIFCFNRLLFWMFVIVFFLSSVIIEIRRLWS